MLKIEKGSLIKDSENNDIGLVLSISEIDTCSFIQICALWWNSNANSFCKTTENIQDGFLLSTNGAVEIISP